MIFLINFELQNFNFFECLFKFWRNYLKCVCWVEESNRVLIRLRKLRAHLCRPWPLPISPLLPPPLVLPVLLHFFRFARQSWTRENGTPGWRLRRAWRCGKGFALHIHVRWHWQTRWDLKKLKSKSIFWVKTNFETILDEISEFQFEKNIFWSRFWLI